MPPRRAKGNWSAPAVDLPAPEDAAGVAGGSGGSGGAAGGEAMRLVPISAWLEEVRVGHPDLWRPEEDLELDEGAGEGGGGRNRN